MGQRSQKNRHRLGYFACLLLLNLAAGGAIAIAKSVDASDPLKITAVQTAVDDINKGDKVAALTRPGECNLGEVLCAHDGPVKKSEKAASARDKSEKTEASSAH